MAFAIQVIPEARYRLARDIRGIGFKIADAVARNAHDNIGDAASGGKLST
jgi:hypothetical protein